MIGIRPYGFFTASVTSAAAAGAGLPGVLHCGGGGGSGNGDGHDVGGRFGGGGVDDDDDGHGAADPWTSFVSTEKAAA